MTVEQAARANGGEIDPWLAYGVEFGCGGLVWAKVSERLDDAPGQFKFDADGEAHFIICAFDGFTPGGPNHDHAGASVAIELVAFRADFERPLTYTGSRCDLGLDWLHADQDQQPVRYYRSPWEWLRDGGVSAGLCLVSGA